MNRKVVRENNLFKIRYLCKFSTAKRLCASYKKTNIPNRGRSCLLYIVFFSIYQQITTGFINKTYHPTGRLLHSVLTFFYPEGRKETGQVRSQMMTCYLLSTAQYKQDKKTDGWMACLPGCTDGLAWLGYWRQLDPPPWLHDSSIHLLLITLQPLNI